MKKILLSLLLLSSLSGCSTLTYGEKATLRQLEINGITIDQGSKYYEKPASPLAAGLLNVLPGFGNFYLAMGDGGASEHFLFGFANLLWWPISAVWAIPEGAIDADNINKRELVYYYKFNPRGKKELEEKGITLE